MALELPLLLGHLGMATSKARGEVPVNMVWEGVGGGILTQFGDLKSFAAASVMFID